MAGLAECIIRCRCTAAWIAGGSFSPATTVTSCAANGSTMSTPSPTNTLPVLAALLAFLGALGPVQAEPVHPPATRINGDPGYSEEVSRLAARGDANAQWLLAMSLLGADSPRYDVEAVRWLELAAQQGHPLAQRALGALYQSGRGVPQDDVRAYAWYVLGARQGSGKAAEDRDALGSRLTPEQLAAAMAIASSWKPAVSPRP
jgi:uncharacterized protein